MERSHPRSARVFEMRFYGGMTNGQIARVLDVSPRVVQEDWNIAKLWLRRRFDESPQE